MELGEFAGRLDELFDVWRFPEPHGWNFALGEGEKSALLAHASPTFAATFNGLLEVGGGPDREITRVYCLVFPERLLVERVIEHERERGRPGAVILTHHPVDMETAGLGFRPIPKDQLEALSEARVAIYVLHAPLDCHPEISTSGAIAAALGLDRERAFAPYVGGDCGVIGVQVPQPFEAFAARVRELCELPFIRADQIRYSGRPVRRVAIVAGGGDNAEYIAEAEGLGCDTYLAGHWWTPHQGEWCDLNRALLREAIAGSRMNFLSASHDGSELDVFRDRLQPMIASWGIEALFVRQADHWR